MIYYKLKGKKIFAHHRVSIRGLRNIETRGLLNIGTIAVGFLHRNDRTVLNIQGKATFLGRCTIGRGCRIDIGHNAVVEIDDEAFINVFTTIVIMHGLRIGKQCVISWHCQFLDEDFHNLQYEGRKQGKNEITIGDKVWIGANTCIYKGTVIPDGCVVAANSAVRGVFTEKNALIAGNPAKVIKHSVSWSN